MVRGGIYSMQDFHFFRLVEYGNCIKDLQFPCRWSGASGLGYGEPLFNFYGQGSYLFGQVFRLVGFSNIASLKLLFIFSIIGSGITMFLLSKKIWNNNLAGLISAVIYMYAPYRALDVWVRGALPEAISFVIFPLLIYELELWIEKKNIEYVIFFSLLLALLISTHNLSFIIFLVFLLPYLVFKFFLNKSTNRTKLTLLVAFLTSLLLSSFYILPVIFESKFINLTQATTLGYFDFRAHFVTLKQIFFSRFWGYGASVWGEEDGMNLSIGLVQWIVPLIVLVSSFVRKTKNIKEIVLFFGIGVLGLFLTHNKSTFIWQLLPFMKYIQFPWRFLSVSLFSFSLVSGAIVSKNQKLNYLLVGLAVIFSIFLNYSYFREDIWYKVSDKDLTTGQKWEDQTRASIGDFWPNFGKKIPKEFAPKSYDNEILLIKRSNYYRYSVYSNINSTYVFPVTYFPGWVAYVNDKKTDVTPMGDYGLIGVNIPEGKNTVELKFTNTVVRYFGNILSLLSLVGVIVILIKNEKK